jgi:hypothetical protein
MMQQHLCSIFRLVAIGAASLILALPQALAAPSDAGWTILHDERGTSVQYPREVFPIDAGQGTPQGRMFATPDGRARLHVFAIRNERGESPQQFLRRVFPRNRGRLSYDRVSSNFFAVSQPSGARILYRRCNFPGDGIIRCVDLQYPRSEKRAWDGIVTRISLSLRPR